METLLRNSNMKIHKNDFNEYHVYLYKHQDVSNTILLLEQAIEILKERE